LDEEEEEMDADRMFLLSLLPTMRKLRGYQKSVIRIEIAQILHKALYEPELMPVVSFSEGQEGFHHLAGLFEKSPASSTMSCEDASPAKMPKVCKCHGQCKCRGLNGIGEMVNGTGEMVNGTGEMVNGTGETANGTEEMVNGTGEKANGIEVNGVVNGEGKRDEDIKQET